MTNITERMKSNLTVENVRFLMKQFPCKAAEGDAIHVMGRLQYAFITEPRQEDNAQPSPSGKIKYSTALLCPLGYDITALQAACEKSAADKFGKHWHEMGVKTPVKPQASRFVIDDATSEKIMRPGFVEGAYYIDATTYKEPGKKVGCVRPDGRTPCDPSEIFSGAWAYLSVNPGSYDAITDNGARVRGVKLLLRSVMILGPDRNLGPTDIDPSKEFAGVKSADDLETIFGAPVAPEFENPFGA